jgi:ubiquinone/menaquinone biosynthesis C-methylase UbiE
MMLVAVPGRCDDVNESASSIIHPRPLRLLHHSASGKTCQSGKPKEAKLMSDDLRERIREQFGRATAEYTLSASHSDPVLLERVFALLQPSARELALDLATGSGHTALTLAPYFTHVVALDVTPQMLREARANAQARNLANLDVVLGDVVTLPFFSATFDAAACRIAPHHFADLDSTLQEIARVLRPGGKFYVLDCSAPDDPEALSFIDEIEKLRDPSHVALYPPQRWRQALAAAAFKIKELKLFPRRYDLYSWLDRAHATERARHLIFRKIARRTPRLVEFFRAQLDGPAPYLQSYFVEIVAIKE